MNATSTQCMLSNAGLPKDTTAFNLVNWSPSTSIGCKTPVAVWSGKPADYSHIKISGYPTYVHVKNGKANSKTKKCIS